MLPVSIHFPLNIGFEDLPLFKEKSIEQRVALLSYLATHRHRAAAAGEEGVLGVRSPEPPELQVGEVGSGGVADGVVRGGWGRGAAVVGERCGEVAGATGCGWRLGVQGLRDPLFPRCVAR